MAKLKISNDFSNNNESSSESFVSSPSDSSGISTITEEEEYMAECLMLLSHAVLPLRPSENKLRNKKFKNQEQIEAPTIKNSLLHECKTCYKTFSSFQALGGHRASHKRPKSIEESDQAQKYEKPNTKIRVHECLICGSRFSSGQALGGHMRRHQQKKEQKSLVELDLNFPPPAGEDTDGSEGIVFYVN